MANYEVIDRVLKVTEDFEIGYEITKTPIEYEVTIAENAFYGCQALTVAEMDSVETIGLGAFTGTNLIEVIFGQSLETLDAKAFYEYTFLDANGGKVKASVDDMVGKSFMGQGRILTQSA